MHHNSRAQPWTTSTPLHFAAMPADENARTLLEHVVRAVRARTPVDCREKRSIERFVIELGRLADPMSEHADPVHITASGIVTGPRGVVLHRHRLLGIWVAPGGHIDAGETPWEAALRETAEETGLAVGHRYDTPELVHVDVHDGPRGHTHLDLSYLLDGGDADPAPPPDESQEIDWFPWTDAPAIADARMAGVLRFLAAMPP
jgi:8-oxo-dGTP pyrophosphatase MutT (NUDIX family)